MSLGALRGLSDLVIGIALSSNAMEVPNVAGPVSAWNGLQLAVPVRIGPVHRSYDSINGRKGAYLKMHGRVPAPPLP